MTVLRKYNNLRWLSTLALLFLLLGYNSTYAQNDTINQRINGKKEGYWIKYKANKEVKWEGHFVKGQRTGFWKIYQKNGIHHSEGQLINGERIGNWYLVHTESMTKLDMTKWDGKGNRVGGATLTW